MASNIVSTLAIFFLMTNVAGAVVMIGIVNYEGNPVFSSTDTGGYVFTEDGDLLDFSGELEQDIRPSGSIDNRGDQIYRVLDTMGLGFILRFMNTLDKYMYGFINLLDIIIGSYLSPGIRALLFGVEGVRFGAFKAIITISYVLFGISLFTGKDVIEGR